MIAGTSGATLRDSSARSAIPSIPCILQVRDDEIHVVVRDDRERLLARLARARVITDLRKRPTSTSPIAASSSTTNIVSPAMFSPPNDTAGFAPLVRFLLVKRENGAMDVITAAFTALVFLAIAGLAASRGRTEPLAARFAVLCVMLFAYDALVLFATLSERPEWIRDWLALATARPRWSRRSSITTSSRSSGNASSGGRRSSFASFAYFGAIAVSCLRPSLYPHRLVPEAARCGPHSCSIGIGQFAASSVVLLFRHARRSAADERARALLVIAAVAVAACGNAADLITITSTVKLPSVGSWALVASALLIAAATLRTRLLERMSVLVALNVVAVAFAVAFGEIALFRSLGGRTAALAIGSIVIAVAALAAGRFLLSNFVQHRERLLTHATLGRMSEQMAHDLRNPLGIIKGHAQALQIDLEQGKIVKPEALAPIIEHVDRMARTIDDYKRIGRVEPQLRETNVNDVVKDAITPCARSRARTSRRACRPA